MSELRISTDNKKEEAIRRMKLFGIFSETIKQFDKDGCISISEPPVGAFYWAESEDLVRIRRFESEHNALVYLVVRSYMTIGMRDSYIYVSDYVDEWEADREGIQSGEVLAYVYNHDDPECSEIGYVGVERTSAAGLRRIW